MWIVLSLLCLLVLYYIIWSIIFVRTADVLPAQRHGHVMVAIASVLLVIPLLVFQVPVLIIVKVDVVLTVSSDQETNESC